MSGSFLPVAGYQILNRIFCPQKICHFGSFGHDEAIYLNVCVILGRSLSNRVAVYLIIPRIFIVTII